MVAVTPLLGALEQVRRNHEEVVLRRITLSNRRRINMRVYLTLVLLVTLT